MNYSSMFGNHALHFSRLTPDRLILSLLVAETLLWLSDQVGWPAYLDCQLWTLAPALPPR
jgi:hypothetical protein